VPWLGRFDSSTDGRDIEDTDPSTIFLPRTHRSARAIARRSLRRGRAVRGQLCGRFLTQALATLGDNTVVVVMADHGESFANGYGGHGGPGLYDSIIHVPLIVKMPHQTAAMRIAQPVEQIDIAPTLATLAGVAAPTSWEGRSLVPLWHEDSEATNDAPRPVFSMNLERTPAPHSPRAQWPSCRDPEVDSLPRPAALRTPARLQDELYDLSNDPEKPPTARWMRWRCTNS